MPGYREYRAGEIWFYYNPSATKEREQKLELGSVTSRPVVIIQDAFYLEWNDSITVVPMTSSDRRSGIFIDNTILYDGTFLEGGTVLPYLLHTVKTKFLYPICTSCDGKIRRHMVSLSKEDFQEVKKSVAYHLGFSDDEPEYIKNWKHVDNYTRTIIGRSVRLAIDNLGFSNGITPNVRLEQPNSGSNYVENHIVHTCDTITDDRTAFIVEDMDTANEENHCVQNILFTPMSVDQFIEWMDTTVGGAIPVIKGESDRIYEGSDLLEGINYKDAVHHLTAQEVSQICQMTLNEIVENTAIKSQSSASRLRIELRSLDPNFFSSGDTGIPPLDPFIYNGRGKLNKNRTKRNIKRRHTLFKFNKQELLKMVSMDIPALQEMCPDLPPSTLKALKVDIAYMFPEATVEDEDTDTEVTLQDIQTKLEEDAQKTLYEENHKTYRFWETLSPSEIAEIASFTKRNTSDIMRKYGIPKLYLQKARQDATDLSRKTPSLVQPPIDNDRQYAVCEHVVKCGIDDLTRTDMLVFCRSDYDFIAQCYSAIKSANTPSKQRIAKMKLNCRRKFTEFG